MVKDTWCFPFPILDHGVKCPLSLHTASAVRGCRMDSRLQGHIVSITQTAVSGKRIICHRDNILSRINERSDTMSGEAGLVVLSLAEVAL